MKINEILRKGRRGYNRVLTLEEKESMDADSFGYLLGLYHIGSVDHIKLENLIDNCITIAVNSRERLEIEKTKRIVNILLFYDRSIDHLGDVIPFLGILDDFYENDIVH